MMRREFDNGSVILERLLISYGVKSKVELAELLGLPASTINNWVGRDSVPGNYIIQCSLDTGADLSWLVYGKLAKSSSELDVRKNKNQLKGKALYEQVLSSGGKAVLRRMLDAYGFSMQKELGDLFGLSSGTISTWIRRDYFPGDVVVSCALDTGVSLSWLATGIGPMRDHDVDDDLRNNKTSLLSKFKLVAGQLNESGSWGVDNSLLPNGVINPAYVDGGRASWIVDLGITNIANGRWLIDIDGNHDVYDIARLPGNKLNVSGSTDFQCSTEDLKAVGIVLLTLERNSQ